jgi:hypothetical protein
MRCVRSCFSDKTPPVFTKSCPSNIRISLSHNGTATANWTVPVAEDNTRISPKITVQPSDAIPPYSINKSIEIEYSAKDKAGNIGKCSFKIVVEGLFVVVNIKTFTRNIFTSLIPFPNPPPPKKNGNGKNIRDTEI